MSEPPPVRHTPALGKGTYGSVVAHPDGALKVFKSTRCRAGKERDIGSCDVVEMEILSELAPHPNIIEPLDIGTYADNDYVYYGMVMERMEGNLADFIQRYGTDPLYPVLVKIIIYKVFLGLEHVHALDYVHRDMKLENVLYRYKAGEMDIDIKICDFGLACDLAPVMTPRLMTQAFRAPELTTTYETDEGGRQHNDMYTQAVDVWGGGVMASELYTRSRVHTYHCKDDGFFRGYGMELGGFSAFRNKISEKVDSQTGMGNNAVFKNFLECSLALSVPRRASAADLLDHALFEESMLCLKKYPDL